MILLDLIGIINNKETLVRIFTDDDREIDYDYSYIYATYKIKDIGLCEEDGNPAIKIVLETPVITYN